MKIADSNYVSQADRVIAHLQVWGKISNAEAHETYGIRHLPSVIRTLKKKGYAIKTEDKNGVNRFGQKVYYVDYILAA